MSDSSTQTITRDSRRWRGDATRPRLYIALDADRPLAPPARIALDGVDLVEIGRGAKVAAGDRIHRKAPSIALRLPDSRLSGSHARMMPDGGGWAVEDLQSKNGTMVNGARIERAALRDGDFIELGHTFLVYREAPGPSAADVDVDEVAETAPGLLTLDPALADQFAKLAKVAASSAPILIMGESGTGKELAARAVHRASGRSGRFVAVNCGALPRELVEAELFGHQKGAFSGAIVDRPGHVRSADGGTLFLDEIGDLAPSAQAAFLRVLQEHEVVAVGTSDPVSVDIRVVAATNRDLPRMANDGQFRSDLYARLAGLSMAMPPLRERRQDLGLILAALLKRVVGELADELQLGFKAARALFLYRWPHNVRELENYLSAAASLANDATLRLEHFPEVVRAAQRKRVRQTDGEREKELVALLQAHRGNVSKVARQLNTTRAQIHRLAKRFGVNFDDFRD